MEFIKKKKEKIKKKVKNCGKQKRKQIVVQDNVYQINVEHLI